MKASRTALREKKSAHSFRDPSGKLITTSLLRSEVTRKVLYELDYGAKFKPTTLCGEFLEALLAIVFARPAYVRDVDTFRYASLIHEFKSFEIDARKGKRVPVSTLPLSDLDRALLLWINPEYNPHEFALMSSYRLDAGHFIKLGGYISSDAEIASRIDALSDKESVFSLDDPGLKSGITGDVARSFASLLVPPGFRLQRSNGDPIVSESCVIYFKIERCHLSSGFYDIVDLEVEESSPPEHDIAEDFRFIGELYDSEESVKANPWPPPKFRQPKFMAPGNWITAILVDGVWKDVPHWAP